MYPSASTLLNLSGAVQGTTRGLLEGSRSGLTCSVAAAEKFQFTEMGVPPFGCVQPKE